VHLRHVDYQIIYYGKPRAKPYRKIINNNTRRVSRRGSYLVRVIDVHCVRVQFVSVMSPSEISLKYPLTARWPTLGGHARSERVLPKRSGQTVLTFIGRALFDDNISHVVAVVFDAHPCVVCR